ncbi:pseudouridine synthase family protein [Desulfosporosinus orientis DSM 765]|uniref:Pseudouridine synthase n=1 Tax=Desulfosporosinus orientis (strain ATCC 19365 / DSM 765 / NCIMB 8382 / VKM B-1628 / Singapore I) TaxID=768706 RepID=G7WAK6_DESOD|nr:pseudouridine synthase [Desulfosporosinus orientis]AET66774.1 pseudouridine synthase family protein [Desulfosporosinus orientis DSM 765]
MTQNKEGGERIQKVLAQAGVASRRHAEQLIIEGRVRVNGVRISELGCKVSIEDHIEVDGKPIKRSEKLHYYLLNKPVGVITSAHDPQGRPTVIDYMKGVPVRVYPVGRLDYDTSGALVLTNDGELAHRLMHPSYGVEKTYRVWVRSPVSLNALELLRRGVLLEDGNTAPAIVERLSGVSQTSGKSKENNLEVLEVTIHEGRNRQVRRMFAAVGYPVVKLERIRFGSLSQGYSLPTGAYRALTKEEIKELRSKVGL